MCRQFSFYEYRQVTACYTFTLSQGTRIGDLRRSRYIGLVKTRLQHLLVAAGINLLRVCAWLADVPRSHTRCSAFAALAASPT